MPHININIHSFAYKTDTNIFLKLKFSELFIEYYVACYVNGFSNVLQLFRKD